MLSIPASDPTCLVSIIVLWLLPALLIYDSARCSYPALVIFGQFVNATAKTPHCFSDVYWQMKSLSSISSSLNLELGYIRFQ